MDWPLYFFFATGQDVACVSEASIGITRMEVTAAGDLYASVTPSKLNCRYCGWRNRPPTQKECLESWIVMKGQCPKIREICRH
ncbi:MAG: hypothetical protein IPP46_20640 [Bacteroidetes bacterium]|nr:hypothetical protein [Bacteroidota bacterium]